MTSSRALATVSCVIRRNRKYAFLLNDVGRLATASEISVALVRHDHKDVLIAGTSGGMREDARRETGGEVRAGRRGEQEAKDTAGSCCCTSRLVS